MKNVIIVGAGRVGRAFNRILQATHLANSVRVILLDTNPAAVANLDNAQLIADSYLETAIRSLNPAVVVCSTPFNINTRVAKVAAELGIHYMDFTEDNEVTRFIESLDVKASTFVPQTGLAPGLVSYLGHSLFEKLGEPWSLDLRVGALTQVSFGPAHYAITWSPAGLINEYVKPALRKVDGEAEEVAPLQDLERLQVRGVEYEAFTTAGGIGTLAAYDHIPNVEYKTLRRPGHLDVVKRLIDGQTFDDAVKSANTVFQTTRDDLVVLVAHASDTQNNSASIGLHFYPDQHLGLTALEMTTAGTGVAVLELLLRGDLPKGILTSAQVPLSALQRTQAYAMVLATAR